MSIYVCRTFNSIQNCFRMMLMSGDAINCHWRHGCLQAFTPAAFPPTTLIRLYELLKNNSLFRSRPQDWMNQRSGLRRSNVRIEDNTTCTMRACWWRMTGSNRRPPACKAGALPAELIPHAEHRSFDLCTCIDGGSGWIRTNDPRLIKTVL